NASLKFKVQNVFPKMAVGPSTFTLRIFYHMTGRPSSVRKQKVTNWKQSPARPGRAPGGIFPLRGGNKCAIIILLLCEIMPEGTFPVGWAARTVHCVRRSCNDERDYPCRRRRHKTVPADDGHLQTAAACV